MDNVKTYHIMYMDKSVTDIIMGENNLVEKIIKFVPDSPMQPIWGDTENMTKQFAYFLITNSFMPDNMFAGNTSINALTGLGLFSNAVNNLLSNVIDSKYGSFGITYNQATETTSAEYGLKANANILKDRVTMSTRIGYYDDQTATDVYQNIYGNFTVEYNINKSGTWRLKAYTYIGDRDNTYFYENNYNNYTAGVALAFKQDFDNRKRIKNRKSAQKK